MFYDITRTRTIAHDNSIPMFANIVNLLVYVLQAGYICIYMSNKSWLMYIITPYHTKPLMQLHALIWVYRKNSLLPQGVDTHSSTVATLVLLVQEGRGFAQGHLVLGLTLMTYVAKWNNVTLALDMSLFQKKNVGKVSTVSICRSNFYRSVYIKDGRTCCCCC